MTTPITIILAPDAIDLINRMLKAAKIEKDKKEYRKRIKMFWPKKV